MGWESEILWSGGIVARVDGEVRWVILFVSF